VSNPVIPAKAGIHSLAIACIPAFAGMTETLQPSDIAFSEK
jgi:hypothetical protein